MPLAHHERYSRTRTRELAALACHVCVCGISSNLVEVEGTELSRLRDHCVIPLPKSRSA